MATILLLDDNEAFRATVSVALAMAGHKVVEAGDGTRLAALMDAHPFDLVITDLVMPNRDGVETIMALRDSHPRLPVIAMSGDAPTRAKLYLGIAQKLGAVRTLQKPFDADTLHSAIRAALGVESGAR
jgi:DNA-binding NtrC family response regulator